MVAVFNQTGNVYIIDPDAAVREGVITLLGTLAIPVIPYADAQQFFDVEAPQNGASGCIMVEAQLQGLSCLEFLKKLRANGNTLPVFVLVSTSNRAINDQLLVAGATEIIEKPFTNDDLLEHLQQVMRQSSGLNEISSHHFKAKNGVSVSIRSIRPEDADIEQAFVQHLSARSRYFRFFSGINKLSPAMLERFTRPSYPHNWALIATIDDAGQEKAVGVARYAPTELKERAEFAIVVADEWQDLGIAHHLLNQLIATARRTDIRYLDGMVLRHNTEMLCLAKDLGFTVQSDPKDFAVLQVTLDLSVAVS